MNNQGPAMSDGLNVLGGINNDWGPNQSKMGKLNKFWNSLVPLSFSWKLLQPLYLTAATLRGHGIFVG